MTPPLGVPWLTWFAIGVNFGSAAVNIATTMKLRRRIKSFEKDRAAYDAAVAPAQRYAEAFEKLVTFAIILANLPDGASLSTEELKEKAKALIPPDIKYDVKVSYGPPPPATRVH